MPSVHTMRDDGRDDDDEVIDGEVVDDDLDDEWTGFGRSGLDDFDQFDLNEFDETPPTTRLLPVDRLGGTDIGSTRSTILDPDAMRPGPTQAGPTYPRPDHRASATRRDPILGDKPASGPVRPRLDSQVSSLMLVAIGAGLAIVVVLGILIMSIGGGDKTDTNGSTTTLRRTTTTQVQGLVGGSQNGQSTATTTSSQGAVTSAQATTASAVTTSTTGTTIPSTTVAPTTTIPVEVGVEPILGMHIRPDFVCFRGETVAQMSGFSSLRMYVSDPPRVIDIKDWGIIPDNPSWEPTRDSEVPVVNGQLQFSAWVEWEEDFTDERPSETGVSVYTNGQLQPFWGEQLSHNGCQEVNAAG